MGSLGRGGRKAGGRLQPGQTDRGWDTMRAFRSDDREAEGAPLLREYAPKSASRVRIPLTPPRIYKNQALTACFCCDVRPDVRPCEPFKAPLAGRFFISGVAW